MIDFNLDPSSTAPLYQQIMDQVRYAIAVGELSRDDCLPSIREAESRYGISRHTVRQAYQLLEAEGHIELRKGRPAVATGLLPFRKIEAVEQRDIPYRKFLEATIRLAEGQGLDAVHLAQQFVGAAFAHDDAYPRFAFFECNDKQARICALFAEKYLERVVIPINLRELGRDKSVLPASIQYVLTPSWHIAESMATLQGTSIRVLAVGVLISAECGGVLRSLEGGEIGLIMRDAESIPGYAECLRQHVGADRVHTALLGDESAVIKLLKESDYVVCTTPCVASIRSINKWATEVIELEYELNKADLTSIQASVFPRSSHEDRSFITDPTGRKKECAHSNRV